MALPLGVRSTDLQQARVSDTDGRDRSAGGVAQPTSVTIAIVAVMKRNRIDSPDVDKPALGRFPELIDVFAPGHGERHSIGQFFN